MADTTPIHWCDSAVNPVMGCNGCELWTPDRKSCYAGLLHTQRNGLKGYSIDFEKPKLFAGKMAKAARWSDLTGTPRPDVKRSSGSICAGKPWLNGLPRLIFISDMGDALANRNVIDADDHPVEGGVSFEFLKEEIITAVRSSAGRRHRWLWLTKQPARMAEFSKWLQSEYQIAWPGNLWAGTTVTSAKTLNRIEQLRTVGEATTNRFLSLEPLWEAVILRGKLGGISWVICGGESKQRECETKEFKLEWARKLRDECQSAGVAFFLKQLGARPTEGGAAVDTERGHGSDWSRWPPDLRVRQVPAPQPVPPPPQGDPKEIRRVPIEDIQIGERHRKRMGNLQMLSDSIQSLGLLHPIGVTSRMQLVWGGRRLEACKRLGWTEIDAVIDPTLDDMVRAMRAEEDENNCRLPFAPSEQVAIADDIEAIERKMAEERRRLHGGTAPGRRRNTSAQWAEVSSEAGDARDKVAAAVHASRRELAAQREVMRNGCAELQRAMDDGVASVSNLALVASLPHDEQREIVAGSKAAIIADIFSVGVDGDTLSASCRTRYGRLKVLHQGGQWGKSQPPLEQKNAQIQ